MDYTGIIAAGLSGALIGAILGIPAFVKDWKKEHYANKPDKFQPNPNGTYRCPVCGMSNDSIKECEGCGYLPPVLNASPLTPPAPPSVKTARADNRPIKQSNKTNDGHTKKEKLSDNLIKNGTIGLLATNTALFYYIIRHVFQYGKALDVDQVLLATAIIDTAPYWKEDEMSKGDIERALNLAKSGTVKIGSYEISHSLVFSDAEMDLLYNLAMQLQAMKHYVDNNVDEHYPVDMVVDYKSQIVSIIDDALRSGQNHPKYKDALRIVTEYLERQDFWELVFNYGLEPRVLEEMIAHKTDKRHDIEQAPTVDDILSEIDKSEPKSAAVPDPAPKVESLSASSPTSIDLSGLTDEQCALVSQLVDSMKK